MSFGSDYGKNTGDYVNAAKDAITTMVAVLPEITIKDETNEFDDKEFKDEYEKIHRDVEEFTAPIIKALNGLPVYYRYHQAPAASGIAQILSDLHVAAAVACAVMKCLRSQKKLNCPDITTSLLCTMHGVEIPRGLRFLLYDPPI